MQQRRGSERYSKIWRSFALEREIEGLLRGKQYALAVIVSQTLLELRIAREVDNLVEGFDADSFGEAAVGLLSSFNPGNQRTQEFFEAALETRFAQEMPEDWRALREHNRRRNNIIHEGAEVTEAEARESLAAVERVSWGIHQLTLRRIGWDEDLEEDERIKREEEGLPLEDEEGRL
jgi:hypothetical protein